MQPSDRLKHGMNIPDSLYEEPLFEMEDDNFIPNEIMAKAKKMFEDNGRGISTKELKDKLNVTHKQSNLIMDRIAEEVIENNKKHEKGN